MGIRLGITGHRPNKLFGYDERHPSYMKMRQVLKRAILVYQADTIVCGGALGTDMILNCKNNTLIKHDLYSMSF